MPRKRQSPMPSDPPNDQELSAWLQQQPASWLADQLNRLAGRDYDLRTHLWQCRRNSQPETWSATAMMERFKQVARPGEFRDERVEDGEIAKIERFIQQLAPLAERNPPLPGFAAVMAEMIEIMYEMSGDWGEGWYWHEVLIAAMRIHATACRHDAVVAVGLPNWIAAMLRNTSYSMKREWLVAAYGAELVAER